MQHKIEGFYTLGVVCEELTPAVKAQVLCDALTLARLARVRHRTNLRIACASDALDRELKFLGVERTAAQETATYWRIYSVKRVIEAPEHATLTEVISLAPGPEDKTGLRKDTVFPENVVYRDVVPVGIQTVPWNRTPPRGPADWTIDYL